MKRRVLLGVALLCGGLVAAPAIACGVILAVPSLASQKFFSENDGSVGPSFYVCLWIWGALSVVALVAGVVPIVLGVLRRDAPGRP